MIRFNRIELVIYPNKPLDIVVIKAKEFGSVESNHKNLKKMPTKSQKIEMRSAEFFPHFRFASFRLDSTRFESASI